jgi:hypothetical protein
MFLDPIRLYAISDFLSIAATKILITINVPVIIKKINEIQILD